MNRLETQYMNESIKKSRYNFGELARISKLYKASMFPF